ncbi:hypothetical protein [uncultured Roseobacter sp.]|uniref:hypothetical protein n=1 Tax=uncultured Roseobacter sp. TaxID=114847 RepID=UPI00260E6740|nr:hypothetical protein [uncultured Roseobacter sp.]
MKSGDWTWLEVTKIGLGVLTPLTLVCISFLIDNSLRSGEAARQREKAILEFSEDIYARRVRAELLASGLRRHAQDPSEQSMSEVIDRKTAYDAAYADWNRRNQSNLLIIRRVLAAEVYTNLEATIEFFLVGRGFAPLDACLTNAYDEAIRGRDPQGVMDNCDVRSLLSYVLNCGYALTDELYTASARGSELRSISAFFSGQIFDHCDLPSIGGRFRGFSEPN